jgi:SNF2 family DNA or RNA helicase
MESWVYPFDLDTAWLSSLGNVNLPNPLRSYQWEGVRFLLDRHSALLADQMGLGKTVQVSVALSLLFRSSFMRRALIVVPASLRLNWEREVVRWAPELSVRRLQGDTQERYYNYLLPINVLIASYEQIRTDAFILSNEVQFEVLVLDEAQRIKNADSDTALACRILGRHRSWALTGTPIENKVSDLLSLLRFISPADSISALNRTELLRYLKPFYLRRRKEEVLPELPPILIQDVLLELTDAQKEAYEAAWMNRLGSLSEGSTSASQVQLFALITKLKQLCNFDPESGESVKLEALRLIIDELYSPEDKLIVFSQYVQTLNWIYTRISGQVKCEVFHGGLSERERDVMLTRFREEAGPRVLLMSLKAAGTGLNLQEATTVVLFDRWWNPAVEAQAIHRAHRFGRDMVLQVFRYLVKDTIEERIDQVLASKEQLFQDYIEAAEVADVPPLTREDILKILNLGDVFYSRPNDSAIMKGAEHGAHNGSSTNTTQ